MRAGNQVVHGNDELDRQLPSLVLDVLPLGVCVAAPPAVSSYCNRAAADLLGHALPPGFPLAMLSQACAIFRAGTEQLYPLELLPLCRALRGESSTADDLELRRATCVPVVMDALPVFDRFGQVRLAVATVTRKPEVGTSLDTLNQNRATRHLEAIGQLSAGVAHEINTPMQYIGDNTAFLGVTLRRLLEVVGTFERLLCATRDGQPAPRELVRECERELGRGRLPFLREQAPTAIEQMLGGVEQVRSIVQALKEFSHPGDEKPVLVDLNHLARMACTVTRNAWRYAADLTLELEETPRRVRGYPQELGQVLINLIVNAAHAVEERKVQTGAAAHGKIVIRTRTRGDTVELEIEDDGAGIPEAIRARVMEPFFTTKPVGRGTGQGLPLARRVVEERHHGKLTFDSQVGVGTRFRVTLPASDEED